MVEENSGPPVTPVVGTAGDDVIGSGPNAVDHINGHAGSDTIQSGDGNDLVAGDMVGQEWTYLNGKWVHNPDAIVSDGAAGDDRVNAGKGQDTADSGAGNDFLNLEDGNDWAQGGLGADTINAGSGSDVGDSDIEGDNLLSTSSDAVAWSLSQYGRPAARRSGTGGDFAGQRHFRYSKHQRPIHFPRGIIDGQHTSHWGGQTLTQAASPPPSALPSLTMRPLLTGFTMLTGFVVLFVF